MRLYQCKQTLARPHFSCPETGTLKCQDPFQYRNRVIRYMLEKLSNHQDQLPGSCQRTWWTHRMGINLALKKVVASAPDRKERKVGWQCGLHVPMAFEAYTPNSQTALVPSREVCAQCTPLLHVRNRTGRTWYSRSKRNDVAMSKRQRNWPWINKGSQSKMLKDKVTLNLPVHATKSNIAFTTAAIWNVALEFLNGELVKGATHGYLLPKTPGNPPWRLEVRTGSHFSHVFSLRMPSLRVYICTLRRSAPV